MSIFSENDPLVFLKGNEHIYQSIVKQDWTHSELGEPAKWPLRLKYAISAQLANPCPSFVVWGKSRTLLYNAAFASLFPGQLIYPGQPNLGFFAFGSHWERVSKSIEDAYQNKGAIVKGVRIGTQGRLGQRYLDISMGSLFELDGEIFGAWGICQEKTFELVAGDILRSSQQYLRSLIGNAPMGICVVGNLPLHIEEVNDEFLRLIGLTERDEKVLEVIKYLLGDLDEYFDGVPRYLKEVAQQQLTGGRAKIGHIDIMVSPYSSRSGNASGITIMVVDVSDRVEAHQELYQVNEELAAANEELAASNEELQAINEDLDLAQRNLGNSLQQLGEREQQIRQMVASAPFPIALYVGREMRIVEANQALKAVWGKGDDVVGKTYYEVLPELKDQSVYEQLAGVYDTAVPFHARHQRIDLVVDGRLQTFYFNYSFTPLLDISGKVYGVMNTAADVTDLVMALKNVQQGEENFKNIILQAPVAMCLLQGADHRIKIANQAMLDIWGRDEDEVMGLPVFEALPDARSQGLEEAMEGVYETGEPFYATEQPVSLLRRGKQDVVFQNFVYQPYRDGDGKVLGVLAISVDVTEMVSSRKKVEDAYGRLNLVVEAADLGMFDMDVPTGKLEWDERCRKFFGVDLLHEVDYQRDFVGGLHKDDVTATLAAVEWAMNPDSGGEFFSEYRTVARNDGKQRWIRATGKVYFDKQNKPERFVGAVSDITQTKTAELQAKEFAERKSRLAAIVDSSDDVIISKDLNGVIATWNPAAQRMFGFTPEEAIGKHISLVIPEERLSEEDLIISRIRKGEKVDHFDTVRQAKDGSPRQLSITVSPIMDAEGNVIGASKIARDISEQLAAKQATVRYTERLEAINLVINAISREVDTSHILQRVTQLTIHLLGAEVGIFIAQEKPGMALADYVAPITAIPQKDLAETAAQFDSLVKDWEGGSVARWDNVLDEEIVCNIEGKQHFIASLLAVPVISSKEELVGNLFFAHQHASYFKKEHEDLLQSITGHLSIGIDKAMLYDKVMELNRKKDEFISLASHELKTPLSGINGYVQILARMIKEDLPGKYLAKTSHQIKKLTSLVNDLLDVSKIEAGKLKFETARLDLAALVASTVEMVEEINQNYHITLLSKCDDCIVEADAQRIEQVITNLLSNAIKYSPGSNLVEVVLETRGRLAVVGIRDFGIGIPKEKMDQLFSRFYRIDEHTANISGLGIGLYLSREIITRHSGKIWVDSELGKGSTFWFSLPLENA
ncbi:sensor histidine kinase [Pedobacter ureilyticus]|uniref:histidine kinase n=1 Tax=Pedobacter ureilyticus TaxID=1393051 RepID=A0ABW9J7H2_9SPHI|nr:PAS domain S-box protein [Pedobacter helvus]